MAQMVPVSPHYQNTGSNAEIKVFDALKEKLSNKWVVIHSFRWVEYQTGSGRKAQGEGDFLIIHPDYGILVVEVKGGGVTYRDKVWYTVNERNQEHQIQDPEKQASETKFEIITRLNAKGLRNCFVCHAVWFPDVLIEKTNLPANLDKSMALDYRALVDPLPFVKNIFAFWSKRSRFKRQQKLTSQQLEEVKKALLPQFRLVKTLKRRCEDLCTTYIRLNLEQFKILEMLELCKEVSISGRAGTGKTIIALEKSRLDAKDGKRVLFLCFNTELAKRLQEDTISSTQIHTIHSYALQYMKKHHPSRVLGFEEDPDFNYLMTEFTEVTDKTKELYDSIIIDEGQDFVEPWINSIRNLLKPDGTFYLFYDPYQHLYSAESRVNDKFLQIGTRVTLKRNMRNPDEISKSCLNVLGHPLRDDYFSGIPGDYPEVIVFSRSTETDEKLQNILHDFQFRQYLSPDNITVLTLEGIESSCLTPKTREEMMPEFTTTRKFKGLENDIIAIVDANLSHLVDPVRQRMMYVALSRARVHAIILFYIEHRYKDHVLDSWGCAEESLPLLIKKKIWEGML